jgi:hypothetical protein
MKATEHLCESFFRNRVLQSQVSTHRLHSLILEWSMDADSKQSSGYFASDIFSLSKK